MPPAKKESGEAAKATPKKTSTRRRTTTTSSRTSSTATAAKKVEANARHIEENKHVIENNTKLIHILYGLIIFLMVIIAGLAFYVGMIFGNAPVVSDQTQTPVQQDISIRVIDDVRCNDCQTDQIVSQIENLPFLAQADITRQDFSDAGVSEYLQENNISALPAVIFNTNVLNDAWQVSSFLQALPNGEFSLALGSTFNPFAQRSDRGFLIAEDEVIQNLQNIAFYEGNSSAAITWVEYTDVNCSFCQRMANDGTVETVLDQFPESVNHTISHFVGVGGQATQNAAEALECIGIIGGDDAFTQSYKNTLTSADDSIESILAFAQGLGVNTAEVQNCIDAGESAQRVAEKFALGRDTFGITGTPGNVLINTQTGEYEIVSGAYPADTFVQTIERLLGQ